MHVSNNIEDFLTDNSNDANAISLYIECLSALNRFEDVKKLIDSLSDALISDQNIQKQIKQSKTL